MGIFSKNKKADEVNMDTRQEEQSGKWVVEDSKAKGNLCYSRLDAQLMMQNHGVVLKLYLENFKHMNDLFGFEYCDELLDMIMQYLELKTGYTVYRYVGVEFIIIMKNRTVKDGINVAEQIIERFNKHWEVGGTDCNCSVQIAICAYPGYAATASQMLKYLDMAISQAAEMGHNQYAIYDKNLHNQFLRRQAIAQYISTAITKGETEISYRPAYNNKQQKFTRAELNMRIFIQNVGMVSSPEYLPVAEDTGQVRQVEYYALDKAASLIARLTQAGIEFESIAVPLSPVLFLQSDFLQNITQIMEKYQIPPKKLAIEIDEYAADNTYTSIISVLQNLSWMGVELILNNFGSGSTGLSQIFELPVDTVKFGRLFIWQLENNPKSAPVNAGLIQIAKKMQKEIVADGVETKAQKDFLEHAGCHLQQGPFYTPVIPEQEIMELLGDSAKPLRQSEGRERRSQRR